MKKCAPWTRFFNGRKKKGFRVSLEILCPFLLCCTWKARAKERDIGSLSRSLSHTHTTHTHTASCFWPVFSLSQVFLSVFVRVFVKLPLLERGTSGTDNAGGEEEEEEEEERENPKAAAARR